MTAKTKLKNRTCNTLIYLAVFLSLITRSYAQDCKANFEAEAGPGIDVCEGGSVNLTGIIGGDASEAVWRGGKGTFNPSRRTLAVEYTPAEEEIGSGVVLILVASNPKFPNCPPKASEIKIKVNSQPQADAGPDVHICANETFKLNGTVKGKAKSVTWTTNGTGKFDNPHRADAVYTPSPKDLADGACSLEFTAIPYGVCETSTDAMILMFNAVPKIVTDTNIAVTGKSVKLNATVTGEYDKALWETTGSGKFENADKIQTNYISSGDDKVKKTVALQLSVSKGSCTTKQPVILHYNPQAGSVKNQ